MTSSPRVHLGLALALVGCGPSPDPPEPGLIVEQATSTVVFQASTDFSSTQGVRGWSYLDRDRNGGEQPMRFDASQNRWQGREQYALLWAGGGHPGNTYTAILRWKAPASGSLHVTGRFADGHSGCGTDGVSVSVRRASALLWSRTIVRDDTTGASFDLTLSVAGGDALDFVVAKGIDNGCDSTSFNPRIELIASPSPPGGSTSPSADARYVLLTEPKVSPAASSAIPGDLVERFSGADGGEVVVTVRKPLQGGSISIAPGSGESGDRYFARAVSAAKSAGARLLKIPAGTYRFSQAAVIRNISDLVIDGSGSTFVFSNNPYTTQGGLRLELCTRIAVRNLNIEWDLDANGLRLASMGRVVASSGGAYVQLSTPPAVPLKARAVTEFVGGEWSWDRPSIEDYLDDNTWIGVDGRSPVTAALSNLAGKTVMVRHFIGENAGVSSYRCDDLTLDAVVLRRGPSLGFLLTGGRGLHVKNCRVERKIGDLISASADAVHVSALAGDIVIEGNDFSFQGDDSVNIHGNLLGVASLDGLTARISGKLWMLDYVDAGSAVMFFDSGYNYLGQGVVSAADPASGTIAFTSGPPAATKIILNLSMSPRRFIIRDNYFHQHRGRGVLVSGADGLVQGNTIEKVNLAGIHVNASTTYWGEGPGGYNVTVTKNRLADVGANNPEAAPAAINILSDDPIKPASPVVNRVVKLAGNVFASLRNPQALAVHVDETSSDVQRLGDHYWVQRTYDAGSGDHDLLYSGHVGTGRREGDPFFGVFLDDWTLGLVPLYNCRSGSDNFASRDRDCAGATKIGTVGYLWAQPGGTAGPPVYECRAYRDSFVSMRSDCEGPDVTRAGILGYSALPGTATPVACAGTTLTWGMGCSASVPASGDGTTLALSSSAPGTSGSAAATCSAGSWTLQASACAAAAIVFEQPAQLTGSQGTNGWYYQKFNGSYTNLDGFDGAGQRWFQAGQAYLFVGGDWMHPGGAYDPVKRWVAPAAGSARITGTVSRPDPNGDGVQVAIIANDAWIWSRDLRPGETASFDLTRSLAQGDWIAFKVHKRGDTGYDYTHFTQRIALSSP